MFDVCEAFWVFADLWNDGGLTERDRRRPDGAPSIHQQLHRMMFRPADSCSLETLTPDGVEIYLRLVARWHPDRLQEEQAELQKVPAR